MDDEDGVEEAVAPCSTPCKAEGEGDACKGETGSEGESEAVEEGFPVGSGELAEGKEGETERTQHEKKRKPHGEGDECEGYTT